jgi:hypothetical protein
VRYPISAAIARGTAVVVSNVTFLKVVVSTLVTAPAKDKTVAVVVDESIYQFHVGKIQSLYGVLQRSLSSADCYRASVLASYGVKKAMEGYNLCYRD